LKQTQKKLTGLICRAIQHRSGGTAEKTQPRLTGIIYRNANAEAVEMLRQNPDN
jgi:hypothetical protein